MFERLRAVTEDEFRIIFEENMDLITSELVSL